MRGQRDTLDQFVRDGLESVVRGDEYLPGTYGAERQRLAVALVEEYERAEAAIRATRYGRVLWRIAWVLSRRK